MSLRIGALLSLLVLQALGCDSEKPKAAAKPLAPAKPSEPEPAPPPAPKTGPAHVSIDDLGPSVEGNRVTLTAADGRVTPLGLDQLKKEISSVEAQISGKSLVLEVARAAKPVVVAHVLSELFAKNPEKLSIQTETRADYPKELVFVPARKSIASCSVTGVITKERASAIWKVQGGAARRQVKGMSGPDLTMAQTTIDQVAKGCQSDVFVVGAAEGVDWGLTYDLAGAAKTAEKAGVAKIALPVEPLTLGRAVVLEP